MEQLEILKLRLGITENTEDALLASILDSAESIIINKRFPFETEETPTLEDRYKDLQIRISVELYNKIGAEGETVHKENGIDRTYSSASVSQSLLDEIVPKVRVV